MSKYLEEAIEHFEGAQGWLDDKSPEFAVAQAKLAQAAATIAIAQAEERKAVALERIAMALNKPVEDNWPPELCECGAELDAPGEEHHPDCIHYIPF